MSLSEIQSVLVVTLSGLLSSTFFLLALFVGFCFFAGLMKLRKRTRNSMVVRSLAERIDGEAISLRRRPGFAIVALRGESTSPPFAWGCSSAGRALQWH